MRRHLYPLILIIMTGCGGRQGTVLKTWTSLGDYSINISADRDEVEMTVTPSVRMETIEEVFTNHLELNLRYPDAHERVDVGIVSIFTPDDPRVELPTIRVKVDYFIADELISSGDINEEEHDWINAGNYRLAPGQSRKLRIRNAAGHRMVVTRSRVYDEQGEELLTRYLHGFELE